MDIQERLARHLGKVPDTSRAAFVAANATVLGDVTLGAQSSVWYGAVLRGDINCIEIGEGANIQDLAMVHLADDYGTKIGRYCTIGHGAIIHACDIGDECLIGMGATILNGAHIGEESIVAAMSFVKAGMIIPPRSMVMGMPARVVRELTDKDIAWKSFGTKQYHDLAIRSLQTMREVEALTEPEAERRRIDFGPDMHAPKD